jgi:hypothetical protein
MRLDEYQIANALIDTRLVMTSRLVERDWAIAFSKCRLAPGSVTLKLQAKTDSLDAGPEVAPLGS